MRWRSAIWPIPIGDPRGVFVSNISGDAMSSRTSEAAAEFLNRDHEKGQQRHGPEHRVSVRSSSLDISADAARIVVRNAREQSRTELPQKATPSHEPG